MRQQYRLTASVFGLHHLHLTAGCLTSVLLLCTEVWLHHSQLKHFQMLRIISLSRNDCPMHTNFCSSILYKSSPVAETGARWSCIFSFQDINLYLAQFSHITFAPQIADGKGHHKRLCKIFNCTPYGDECR